LEKSSIEQIKQSKELLRQIDEITIHQQDQSSANVEQSTSVEQPKNIISEVAQKYVGQRFYYSNGHILDASNVIITDIGSSCIYFPRGNGLQNSKLMFDGSRIPVEIVKIETDEKGEIQRAVVSVITSPFTFIVGNDYYGGEIFLQHNDFGRWTALKTKPYKKGQEVSAQFELRDGLPSVVLKIIN
jgi:hypothetical protein